MKSFSSVLILLSLQGTRQKNKFPKKLETGEFSNGNHIHQLFGASGGVKVEEQHLSMTAEAEITPIQPESQSLTYAKALIKVLAYTKSLRVNLKLAIPGSSLDARASDGLLFALDILKDCFDPIKRDVKSFKAKILEDEVSKHLMNTQSLKIKPSMHLFLRGFYDILTKGPLTSGDEPRVSASSSNFLQIVALSITDLGHRIRKYNFVSKDPIAISEGFGSSLNGGVSISLTFPKYLIVLANGMPELDISELGQSTWQIITSRVKVALNLSEHSPYRVYSLSAATFSCSTQQPDKWEVISARGKKRFLVESDAMTILKAETLHKMLSATFSRKHGELVLVYEINDQGDDEVAASKKLKTEISFPYENIETPEKVLDLSHQLIKINETEKHA